MPGTRCSRCCATARSRATRADFDGVWPDPMQLARALDGLVADGLVDPLPDGRYALPGLDRAARGAILTQSPASN